LLFLADFAFAVVCFYCCQLLLLLSSFSFAIVVVLAVEVAVVADVVVVG